MGLNMADGLQGMLKDGHKHFEGVDEAVAKNIEAIHQLSAITRTSLGPTGTLSKFFSRLLLSSTYIPTTMHPYLPRTRYEQTGDQPS
jgi:hypothetical protein